MDDPSTRQTEKWEKAHKNTPPKIARRPDGIPYTDLTSVLTAGPSGPALLQDAECVQVIQGFVRKNVHSRIVHAKGSGCHGYFELTNPDISSYSKACIFDPSKVGQKVDLFTRFGTPDEDGSADSRRSVWTGSFKLYTADGNLDFTCLNFPIFHTRDAKNFQNSIGSRHHNPLVPSGFSDTNTKWNFALRRPESLHFFLFLNSDRGQPITFRHINLFPINIFRFVNAENKFAYTRFSFKTDQGLRFMTDEEATEVRMKDEDYAVRDLYNAVERKDFPSYTWYCQIMERDQVPQYIERNGWNPFDTTKVWPQSQFPLIEIGKIVLNRNMDNFFNESGLSTFNPGSLIPGIEAAIEDRIFLGRIFEYNDAQLHRVGSNKSMIPINRPHGLLSKNKDENGGPQNTYYRGCPMNFGLGIGLKDAPNYYPNSCDNGSVADDQAKHQSVDVEGVLDIHDLDDDDNFTQPRGFYENNMKEDEKERTANNIVESSYHADVKVQEGIIKLFSQVSEDLGRRIHDAYVKRNGQ